MLPVSVKCFDLELVLEDLTQKQKRQVQVRTANCISKI